MVDQIYLSLKQLCELPNNDKYGYLHEIAHKLKEHEELEENKFTIIPGNDFALDLIKSVDLTEYCIVYCPTCKKLQHVTTEGCKGVLLMICDSCNQIVMELFPRIETQKEIALPTSL